MSDVRCQMSDVNCRAKTIFDCLISDFLDGRNIPTLPLDASILYILYYYNLYLAFDDSLLSQI